MVHVGPSHRDRSPRHVSSQGQDQLVNTSRTILNQKEQTRVTSHEIRKLRGGGNILLQKKRYLEWRLKTLRVYVNCNPNQLILPPANNNGDQRGSRRWRFTYLEQNKDTVETTQSSVVVSTGSPWGNPSEEKLQINNLTAAKRNNNAAGLPRCRLAAAGRKQQMLQRPRGHSSGQSQTGKLSDGGKWPKTTVACETRYRPLFLRDGALNQWHTFGEPATPA